MLCLQEQHVLDNLVCLSHRPNLQPSVYLNELKIEKLIIVCMFCFRNVPVGIGMQDGIHLSKHRAVRAHRKISAWDVM